MQCHFAGLQIEHKLVRRQAHEQAHRKQSATWFIYRHKQELTGLPRAYDRTVCLHLALR